MSHCLKFQARQPHQDNRLQVQGSTVNTIRNHRNVFARNLSSNSHDREVLLEQLAAQAVHLPHVGNTRPG